MMKGTELTSLESKTAVKPKVGVNDQWVNVQDPKGDQGYVAAWYVSETISGTPSPAPAAPASAAALPAGALAFYPTEELSLRTQPVVSPSTLIRRIPPTEQVISVEDATVVIPKVGVVNQWLKVRDASGREGYVAAWYVRYAGGSTTQQKAPAASSTGGT